MRRLAIEEIAVVIVMGMREKENVDSIILCKRKRREVGPCIT